MPVIIRVMKTSDARTLSPDAQEAIRMRVVAAVGEGMTQGQAARVFGVSRASVNAWVKKHREQGDAGLESQARGRPAQTTLPRTRSEAAVRAICEHCPDALGLDAALWTREALCAFLAREHGTDISVWTASRYFKRWGFLPQRPLFQATRSAPAPVRRWFEREYPPIHAAAMRLKSEVLWCGDAAVSPEKFPGFSGVMYSAITARNELSFMIMREFTPAAFQEFAERLLRQRGRSVFMMAAMHPVYESAQVREWLMANRARAQLHILPARSPEDAPHLIY